MSTSQSSTSSTWVGRFRGINVGGRHVVPMQELRALLESLGLESVRTYIQSGNAVFESTGSASELGSRIEGAVEQAYGFRPQVLVLTATDLELAFAENPYPDAAEEPSRLHVSFLVDEPEEPDLDTLEGLRANGERFQLVGNRLYLHAPAGIGNSKLATRIEPALGVAGTARNWRTVTRLVELATVSR